MLRLPITLATLAAAVWVAVAALTSPANIGNQIQSSLHNSLPADEEAVKVASVLRTVVPVARSTVVLYLNGEDEGDNYYRLHYLLYPVRFVSYWSWKHPNAGGHVWNKPRFARPASVEQILRSHHVEYVVGIRSPLVLRRIGYDRNGLYIFKVDVGRLDHGDSLRADLSLVEYRP